MAVVATEVPFVDYPRRVAHAMWATKPGLFTYYIGIVDADVDPTNMDEVLHPMTIKCHRKWYSPDCTQSWISSPAAILAAERAANR